MKSTKLIFFLILALFVQENHAGIAGDIASNLWSSIVNGIKSMFLAIGNFFIDVIKWIGTTIMDAVKALATDIFAALSASGEMVKANANKTLQGILGADNFNTSKIDRFRGIFPF